MSLLPELQNLPISQLASRRLLVPRRRARHRRNRRSRNFDCSNPESFRGWPHRLAAASPSRGGQDGCASGCPARGKHGGGAAFM